MTLVKIDRGVALLFGVAFAAVIATGLGMRGDAGVFPAIAGSLGIIACIGLALGTLRSNPSDEPSAPLEVRRLLIICLCVLGLLVLMVTAGTFIALPLFLFAGLRWLARLRWLTSLLISLGFTAMIYLIFVQLLAVPLPSGWLTS
ncbi:hypothetical protein GCM10007160_23970 [Litchfieldella qijiaojingensis]|uniref:DUF1468 domain-containing protein n=1 Tax=Litchfieldella qijiaojingensis TaxID=980347 RepID=A0ABQ2YUB6_9GAMM|nr:tripartite tricarboxylate transporter TctB family protein [Halomonas qijiaojingensis]GGX95576.1 hypothetical protein GCM10007160_23970 [Halomonas qijiaojingensis]